MGRHIGKTHGEFSVCQFFIGGTYEYTRRYVSAEEAVQAFKHYTNNVVARHSIIVERVILTDGGDAVNMEWVSGRGYTYPPELVAKTSKPC